MDIRLTKDASRLLSLLYKAYLERRKAGKSKSQAKTFSGTKEIQAEFLPSESVEDVNETLCELSRALMLNAHFASNLVYFCVLTDQAITVMENRFQDGLKGVAEFLANFL